MKKSLLAILVVFAMIFAFSCGGDESTESTSSESIITSETVSESQSESESLSEEESQSEIETVTVTFIQQGFDSVEITVNKGDGITEVPQPHEVEGHNVHWDVTDFSAITEDMTVTAIVTPNVYAIVYDLGELESEATIASPTTAVTYGEAYTLEIPSCDGYVFVGWLIYGTQESFDSGDAWTLTGDVRLIAVWEIDFTSGSGETGRY